MNRLSQPDKSWVDTHIQGINQENGDHQLPDFLYNFQMSKWALIFGLANAPKVLLIAKEVLVKRVIVDHDVK